MRQPIALALGPMSARRYLLLRSLIERHGDRTEPGWRFRESAADAEVVLFDPTHPIPRDATDVDALVLPVIDRAQHDGGDALALPFPPSSADLAGFLSGVGQQLARGASARQEHDTPSEQATRLRALADAIAGLVGGRYTTLHLESPDGALALSAHDDGMRAHGHADDEVAALLAGPGFLPSLRVVARNHPVSGTGSAAAAQRLVWQLAAALAGHDILLMTPDRALELRRWPHPPSSTIRSSDVMRICSAIAHGRPSAEALRRNRQFDVRDATTLLNAGHLLDFVRAADAPAKSPSATPAGAGRQRHGTLLATLRAAFGLPARAPS
ncbi:hypothetical protein [Algiphilus sp.]|uniref:hypothetical protein n=1 Tax=Algiphilus sp. TaxID=1872431 RepID=UPI0025B84D90|nr:hypothetical protein [Algiphilus sp.]MCK5769538.1 hypothetical protein [Algiphilus sp.]